MDFDSESAVNFFGMTLIVLLYGGLIILVYGNVTSILSEYINKRWLRNHTLTFVIIHLLFGAFFGVFFNEYPVILLGMLGALFYALIDRLLFKQKEDHRITFIILLSPPLIFMVTLVYLWIASPDAPPFTAEDAVAFVASGEGTIIEDFPDEVGKTEVPVGAFRVIRETAVEQIGKSEYIVTFTESWENEHTDGSWYISYIVNGTSGASSQLHDHGGIEPPYKK